MFWENLLNQVCSGEVKTNSQEFWCCKEFQVNATCALIVMPNAPKHWGISSLLLSTSCCVSEPLENGQDLLPPSLDQNFHYFLLAPPPPLFFLILMTK